MIEDPYDRCRAILWMLADIDPEMPLLTALGHMKAVESRLNAMVVKEGRDAKPSVRASSRYVGGQGVVNLVRDFAGNPVVAKAAKLGDRAGCATELAALTGCGAVEAINAAETLISTLA